MRILFCGLLPTIVACGVAFALNPETVVFAAVVGFLGECYYFLTLGVDRLLFPKGIAVTRLAGVVIVAATGVFRNNLFGAEAAGMIGAIVFYTVIGFIVTAVVSVRAFNAGREGER